MPYMKYLVPAAVAAIVAHDLRTQIKARKAHAETCKFVVAAAEHIDRTNKLTKTLIGQNLYLINKLEENDIEPDEFDIIAFNFYNQ